MLGLEFRTQMLTSGPRTLFWTKILGFDPDVCFIDKSWSRCSFQGPELHSFLRCSIRGSVWVPGACFRAHVLILSQDVWLGLKDECYKKLVKKFSLLLPPSLLLPTWSAELKLSVFKKYYCSSNLPWNRPYHEDSKIFNWIYQPFCNSM